MNNPYNLLQDVLAGIENKLRDDINVDIIADEFNISTRHLQRLFSLAFNQTIGVYIRARKLAASIDDLLNTNLNVLDIAFDYGFEHEQSYIKAFKREYGIPPGTLRRTGKIVKITPPLNLFNSKKCYDGIMFGPEIVIVPQFHVIGKEIKIPFRDVLFITSNEEEYFTEADKERVKNKINPDIKIYVSRTAGGDADYFYMMPSVQVKTLDYIPEGLAHYTFETSLCAKFRFIGYDFRKYNMHVSEKMFKAIDDFMDDEKQQYFMERKKVNIDRYTLSTEGDCYLLEWFTPVVEKSSMKIPPYNPSGIKKVYSQKLPALRFIGIKYIEKPEPQNILNMLDNWQMKNIFYDIEKQADIDYKTFYEGADAYISLVKKNNDGLFENWMGMFMPKGTEVPQGFHALDFPEMTIGVCRAYGKRNEVINYEAESENKLLEEGFKLKKENSIDQWYFRRFNWHRFFEEDIYGKRQLDYCYPIKK